MFKNTTTKIKHVPHAIGTPPGGAVRSNTPRSCGMLPPQMDWKNKLYFGDGFIAAETS